MIWSEYLSQGSYHNARDLRAILESLQFVLSWEFEHTSSKVLVTKAIHDAPLAVRKVFYTVNGHIDFFICYAGSYVVDRRTVIYLLFLRLCSWILQLARLWSDDSSESTSLAPMDNQAGQLYASHENDVVAPRCGRCFHFCFFGYIIFRLAVVCNVEFTSFNMRKLYLCLCKLAIINSTVTTAIFCRFVADIKMTQSDLTSAMITCIRCCDTLNPNNVLFRRYELVHEAGNCDMQALLAAMNFVIKFYFCVIFFYQYYYGRDLYYLLYLFLLFFSVSEAALRDAIETVQTHVHDVENISNDARHGG